MKRTVITLTGMATLGIAVYLGNRLLAQTPPPVAPVAPAAPAAPVAPAKPLQTRIGLINMVQVLKDYKKFQTIEQPIKTRSQELEKMLENYRQTIIKMKTDFQNPQTPQAQRDALDKQIRETTMKAQMAEEDAKKELTKLQGDAAVQIYAEVKMAVERFAVANGYEAVFFYNDAVTPTDLMHPVNVQRKLMQPACLMPLYSAPGMDITAWIVKNLNDQYTPMTGGPGAVVAPTQQPH